MGQHDGPQTTRECDRSGEFPNIAKALVSPRKAHALIAKIGLLGAIRKSDVRYRRLCSGSEPGRPDSWLHPSNWRLP